MESALTFKGKFDFNKNDIEKEVLKKGNRNLRSLLAHFNVTEFHECLFQR